MMMKTTNEIIAQTKRMFAMSRGRKNYRHSQIAEIGRAYLHNIAYYYKRPYGLKTWQLVGDKPLPASIYAKCLLTPKNKR